MISFMPWHKELNIVTLMAEHLDHINSIGLETGLKQVTK
jgi:hypothetical protein